MKTVKWVNDWVSENEETIESLGSILSKEEPKKKDFLAFTPASVYSESWGFANIITNLDEENRLVVSYITSLMEGGNCWGDEAYYTQSDEVPEQGFLYRFVLEIVVKAFPGRNFNPLECIRLQDTLDQITKHHEYTEYEYYGNSKDIKSYFVNGGDLFNVIMDFIDG